LKNLPPMTAGFSSLQDEIDQDTKAIASATQGSDNWKKASDDLAAANVEVSKQLTVVGNSGTSTIAQLLHIQDVVEANKPLMDQISTETNLMGDLDAAGLSTQADFIAFGQNAVNELAVLTDKTGDQKEALVLMQPELQKLWEHQQKFHDITDEAT